MSSRSLGDVHPDWEFHTSGVFPGLKPVYRGPDGAAELWEAMRGPWEVLRTENFATWAAALESVGLRE